MKAANTPKSDTPKSDSSAQSSSDFSEEQENADEKTTPTTPTKRPTDNGAYSSLNIEEAETPSRPIRISHHKSPRPETPTTVAFPTARVRRIIRSEGDIRTSVEATFLINKAAERFLEQFVVDSFEHVLEETKNILSYKPFSSTVANQKRYEFLADFVPEKVKAADALAQRASAEI
uniref:Transcription factor CBF/NF-Y/archaeal histone domain-containing protein n=1 Tax=Picea sitchensis TaxID=3332 RepID=D5ACA9_PICSI|nr:unknown [Picea sitchensis]